MLRILITSDKHIDNEAQKINYLLKNDFDILHLRKPCWDIGECRSLLDDIDSSLYGRITVHDFYELYGEYNLRGIHLTGRRPDIPAALHPAHVSCSCHSLEEVQKRKASMSYVFLSPIFDSISKHGYRSTFPYDILKEAARRGIIDEKVIALGGISAERIKDIEEIGFGGFAMLGSIWK